MRARYARWMGVAGALLLLGGCAGIPQTQALLNNPPRDIGRGFELSGVPFFPQERYQCGPAALATVLGWGGIEVAPEDLESQVYVPDRHGSLQHELIAAARRYKRVSYRLDPELMAILREVQSGHPVLVLQNLAYSWYPLWHYAVVIGFDLDRGEMILRSGTRKRHIQSLRSFEYTWGRADRWAVVMLDASIVPMTASEQSYLRAVLAFEQAGDWVTAQDAYRAAMARWPSSAGAAFGLGNAAYRLEDYAGAEAAFRHVLEQQPELSAAMNNLALVLLEQG
ncbi:MAG: PA2778 family cysteine peptidase, partial [Gammaproteobacteria bacterium]|nr:PA2778 family cysteine peptidase [Gammaproteobacteria bacterium]